MLVVLPARQLCSPYNVTRSFPRTLARSKRQCHLELPEPEKPSPAQQVPPVPCTVRTVDVPTFLVQPALFPPLWLLANADERSAIRDLFFLPPKAPPLLLLLHWGLAILNLDHAGRDCPRSAPRCIRHLQLSRANSTAIVRHAEATETACLPPDPSIHPLVHYLPCLVLPTSRYIPTNSISPKLRQRCAALPIPIRIPFIPSLVIPASLFSTLPSRSWRQRPERSFPDRPSTAAAPHHYNTTST